MISEEQEFTHRDTDVVAVANLNQDFLRPERIRIQLDKSVKVMPLDIGWLAYARRKRNENHIENKCNLVVEESLVESRRELLRSIIHSFCWQSRNSTILNSYKLIEAAINWCDANGFSDAFSDKKMARKAYQEYTQYLNNKIAIGRSVPRSCNNNQRCFAKLIQLKFPEDYEHLTSGVIMIKAGRAEKLPPRKSDVDVYLNTSLMLARRMTEFVLNNESFPLVIGSEGGGVVVFPSNSGVITPYTKRKNYVYNAVERRIATIEEYIECSRKTCKYINRSASQAAVDAALDNLRAANSNARHEQRLRLASLAAKAYACVFLLVVGASPTEFIQFDYDEAIEVEKSLVKKELSAIKFRAGGKKTRYAVGAREGVKILKEYFKLRAWILNGRSFDKLFFSMDKSGVYSGGVGPLRSSFSKQYYDSISGIYLDSLVPNVTSGSIRKFKSNLLHSLRYSPETVAEVLNHTVYTNLTDYAQTTIEQQEFEFGSYWQSVRKASEIVRERVSEKLLSTASGHCGSFNSPVPEYNVVAVQPNCQTQYGCLYCKNYVCHSDEEDIHKLASLQYVINCVRDASPDFQHAEDLFKHLSVRIEFIFESIAVRSSSCAKLVSEVKRKVNDLGELTLFWEARLQRYERLGVVF